ncbi:MAG: hypothetical protein IH945_12500 [Armatimonadetes bacterium]|nr:hypothetical protein [Armatimonadota bacterium]
MALDDLAKAFPDADAKFFVVWAPMLGHESHDDAVQQSNSFGGDERFMFYWDEEKRLPISLGAKLRLPSNQDRAEFLGPKKHLPSNRNLAWDVYLLYDKDVTWREEPPEPSFWMHQLGHDERLLDPARLTRAFESLIDPKHEIVFLTREGCKATPEMRARFEGALRRKGLPEAFKTIDMDEVDADDVRTGYGTPTVLIDGMDLMGAAVPEEPAVPT